VAAASSRYRTNSLGESKPLSCIGRNQPSAASSVQPAGNLLTGPTPTAPWEVWRRADGSATREAFYPSGRARV